jgi:hypothetical protein
MKDLGVVVLACAWLALASGDAGGQEEFARTSLGVRHTSAGGSFSVSTPEDWTFETRAGQPEITEARRGPLILRVVRREGELGLDSGHVQCMLQRLAGAMAARPQVEYEYDFRQGYIADRQAMDSAFVVRYDEPIEGHKDWRQRNLTLIGGGESLCVITMLPQRLWKKSREDREILDAVMKSIRFEPWR